MPSKYRYKRGKCKPLLHYQKITNLRIKHKILREFYTQNYIFDDLTVKNGIMSSPTPNFGKYLLYINEEAYLVWVLGAPSSLALISDY